MKITCTAQWQPLFCATKATILVQGLAANDKGLVTRYFYLVVLLLISQYHLNDLKIALISYCVMSFIFITSGYIVSLALKSRFVKNFRQVKPRLTYSRSTISVMKVMRLESFYNSDCLSSLPNGYWLGPQRSQAAST